MKLKVVYILLVISLLGLGILGYREITREKIGVLRMEYVYENFEGSKDAMQKLQKAQEKYTQQTDSLKGLYNYLLNDTLTITRERMAYLREKIIERNELSGREHAKLEQELSAGVLNQMNDYLEEYAEKYNYDIIISYYQGQGALISSERADVTEDFTMKLNAKYNGSVN